MAHGKRRDEGLEEREIHMLIGCSDARDLGGTTVSAITRQRARYRSRGVDVQLHVVRTPGSFATRDVLEDLHRMVERSERTQPETCRRTRYFVHVQTHGEVRALPGGSRFLHDLTIVQGSPFNCGMLGAAGLAIELERHLLDRRPTITLRGKPFTIDHEDRIHHLLGEVYAYDGYLAGEWIRSIDDLRTHCRMQENAVKAAVAGDRLLRNVELVVTAGIQDYAQHQYFRVDGNEPQITFWDEVYQDVRAQVAALPEGHPEIVARTAKQAPRVGLFAMGGIDGARAHAAAHYAQSLGLRSEDFGPNQVFEFSSNSFDLPCSPFGPYTIAGFFYAVVHLGLRHFVVMGHDGPQTRRMLRRLHHDPLVEHIASAHDVAFSALSEDELPTHGRHRTTRAPPPA